MAEVLPVGKPIQLRAGLAEKLQLHLLKLTGAEGEVTGGDLVAEALAHLADAEGQLPAGGPLDVLEVNEDALGGLRPQVHGILGILGDALEGLEHQVELPDVGEVVLAAGGAGDLVLIDKGLHLLLGEGVHRLRKVKVVCLSPVLNDLVGPEALFALLAVHQRIREAAHVAGGHPHLGVHQNGGVQTHIVGVLLDKLLPPGLLHVVLQLHAQGAIVPGVGKAAVDLAAGENKATALAQSNDFLHGLLSVLHVF